MKPTRPIDPVIAFKNSQGERARGTLTNIQRDSLVMEVYNPYSVVQVSEVLSDLTIWSGTEQIIYRGRAFISGLVNTGLMAVVSATLVDDWQESHVPYRNLNSVGVQAQAIAQELDGLGEISKEYQISVSEMKSYFAEINRQLGQIEMDDALAKDDLGRIHADVFFDIVAPLIEKGKSYFSNFESQAGLVEPDLAAIHRSRAQKALHPFLIQAPFVHRAFVKPLGYAGDHELVNQIIGDPRQGTGAYSQLVNVMFLQSNIADAYRVRMTILVERLTRVIQLRKDAAQKFRILAVGCGPAIELERLLLASDVVHSVELVLLDTSEEALRRAKANLEKIVQDRNLAVTITTRQESAHSLLKLAAKNVVVDEPDKYDYIYCVGLFDYLPAKVCTRLMTHLSVALKSGGKMLVANIRSGSADKNLIEHLLEWHFIYRNEADMRKMMPANYQDIDYFTDLAGLNAFIESTYRG